MTEIDLDELTKRLKKYDTKAVEAGWHISPSDKNVHFTTRGKHSTQHWYPDGSKKVFWKLDEESKQVSQKKK